LRAPFSSAPSPLTTRGESQIFEKIPNAESILCYVEAARPPPRRRAHHLGRSTHSTRSATDGVLLIVAIVLQHTNFELVLGEIDEGTLL